MATVLPALSLLLLNAATLSTSSVPATGRQEALLTLDAPGAVHLSARSASGTWCEIIDRVRGPFESSGAVGGANCELDLILDAGQYKLRFESPQRGKGQVTLTATPFLELNTGTESLTPGMGRTLQLKPMQQVTYWLSLKERGVPWVRISGRHAGEVRLWKNGEWLEPQRPWRQQFSPRPGQPMHEWWLDQVLEAGEYKVVVYGMQSTTVTGKSIDDSLTIETGFRAGPPERQVAFTLPSSGVFNVMVPSQELAGVLSLDGAPPSAIEFQALRNNVRSPTTSCRIEKAALAPECVLNVDGSNVLTVLQVRGAPGTRGTVEWAPWRTSAYDYAFGGYYGPTAQGLTFKTTKGQYVVGAVDLPADVDAAPQGCQLEKIKANGDVEAVVARDVIGLGDGEKLEQNFNYDGSGALVWFEIKSGGNMLQKVGLSSRRFRIQGTGERKSTCEVYRLQSNGELKRLTQTVPDAKECNVLLALDPGVYQLQLSGGYSGIETLRIAPDGDSSAKAVAPHGACALGPLALDEAKYRLSLSRRGQVATRGLTVQSLPLTNGQPVHLQLDARRTLELPVRFASAMTVKSTGSAPFGCALKAGAVTATAGECKVPATTDTLVLANTSDAAMSLTLAPPSSMPAFASAVSYTPNAKPPPRISPDQPLWFDFDRDQTQAVTFDVDQPGLYNVTTLGLLSTSCRLRTPVIDEVAENSGAGRGRNCLIQTYLNKGRYLFTATTKGESRGRGGLALSRRPAKEFPGIGGEGEQYFRVEANELVQQKLVVKTAGKFDLTTTGQGAPQMQCRIDDPEGWPLERVPTSCSGQRQLRAGTWLWTQLPLTVESMRHTSMKRPREAVNLTGNKPHKIEAFTWYTAELGADGKDEFLFSLEGETQLDVVLTGGMQGRVFLLEKDKAPRAVEVIPPMQPTNDGSGDSYEAESQPTEEEQPPPERDYESEGDGSYAEGDQDTQQTAPVEVAQARAAPPPPSGVKITLPAGQYKLLTEHSRGDVGVTYQLHLGSVTLLPGMTRTLPAPTVVPLLVPRDGTLRVRTEGEVDVRCRILNENNKLVLEGSENGADWNCAIAEPMTKGRYTLVLESETQQSGETKLTVSLPTVEDKGALTEGVKLTLGGAVASWAIPVAEKDAVQEVAIRSQNKTPISCALEGPDGAVVSRQARVTDCSMLVRPQLGKYRVRAWTTDGSAAVVTSFKSRPLTTGTAGTLGADAAVAITVPAAGRFKTGPGVFCLPAAESGLLRACGPEVSLEAGSTLFAALGGKSVSLSLEENIGQADGKSFGFPLSRQPLIQVVKASSNSLFLLEARVQHGERAAPSCLFDGVGSVRERRESACFAASRVAANATSRLWAASDGEIDSTVSRRAVSLPEKFDTLSTGRRRLTFKDVGRFALPKQGRARLELTLPANAWAVLLDDAGASLDLCAPTKDLRRCVLTGQGGSLALVSSEGQADVTTVMLEGTPTNVAFTGLYEDSPRTPGTVRLSVSPADGERFTTIEGALKCTVALADGTRIASCRAKVPAKSGAELVIEHGVGPLRAMVHAASREKWARLGLELPLVPGAGLSAAVAVPLQAGRIDRTLIVDKEAVVRVASESGVCGLFKGNDLLSVDGQDTGCELVRVLSPGTYRLLVRPFAGRVQPGTLRWTAEPVTQLNEGVGPEDWLAPGEVRLFRFDTANKGKLGLGVQAKSELLECAVYNDAYQLVGEGCHQYLGLDKGRYLLTVRNPPAPGASPLAFKPVLFGLSGEKNDIPEEYLREFFGRVGVSQ